MAVPSIEELKHPTLELLKKGVGEAGAMREALAHSLGLSAEALSRRVGGAATKAFVNNHAWALVRLQAEGMIEKIGPGRYAILPRGLWVLEDPENRLRGERSVEPIIDDRPLPLWARVLVGRARRRNEQRALREGVEPPLFGEADLRRLWQACDGRCALSGLTFTEAPSAKGSCGGPWRLRSTASIRKASTPQTTAGSSASQ
jgi:hypothetical protein